MSADDGNFCCTPDSGDCCGPGSWCCGRAGKHEHPELEEVTVTSIGVDPANPSTILLLMSDGSVQ